MNNVALNGVPAGIPDHPVLDGNTQPRLDARTLKLAGLLPKLNGPRFSLSDLKLDDDSRLASRILRDRRRATQLMQARARVSVDETPPRDEVLYAMDRPRLHFGNVNDIIHAAHAYDIENGRSTHHHRPLESVSDVVVNHNGVRAVYSLSTLFDAAFMSEYTSECTAKLPETRTFCFSPRFVLRNAFCDNDRCGQTFHALAFESDRGIVNVRLKSFGSVNSHIIQPKAQQRVCSAIVDRLVTACGSSHLLGITYKVIARKRFACVLCLTQPDDVSVLVSYLHMKGVRALHAWNIYAWPVDCSSEIFVTDNPDFLGLASLPVIVDHGNFTSLSDTSLRHRFISMIRDIHGVPTLFGYKDLFRRWLPSALVVDCYKNVLDVFHVVHFSTADIDLWRWHPPISNT